MKNSKPIQATAFLLCYLLIAGNSKASDGDPLQGLDFGGHLDIIPMPKDIAEQAKKDHIAMPSDIKAALDACRAEGNTDFDCPNQKLQAAGFRVPELNANQKALNQCLKDAKANGNKPEAVKACFDKYAPAPGLPGGKGPQPPVDGSATDTATSTSTDTSTSSSTTTNTGGTTSAL